jgi:hypothetical protein
MIAASWRHTPVFDLHFGGHKEGMNDDHVRMLHAPGKSARSVVLQGRCRFFIQTQICVGIIAIGAIMLFFVVVCE